VEAGIWPAGSRDAEQGKRLEIRGGADVRGQVGSERRRKGRGLTHGPGLAAAEKEERKAGPRWFRGPEEESRPAGKKERLGRARTSWAGGKKIKRKEGEREVGRREPFWAEGRAGPRAKENGPTGTREGGKEMGLFF
jgi:hypothetical protein